MRTVWNLAAQEGLQITQDVFVVGTTTANSTIYHTVRVHNVGEASVRIGWRNLYDWSFGGRTLDRPVNTFESVCGTEIDSASDTEALAPFGTDLVRLSLDGQGYDILLGLDADPAFSPLAVTQPDQYAFVNWGSASSTAFDYSLVPPRTVSDSAGISWFGRDQASAWEIAPGGSVRFTQVLFAVPPDSCVEPCAEIRPRGEILCDRDGSGDVTLKLIAKNLTQDEIHHLFVFDNDPNSDVEIVDDYINFPEMFGQPLGIQGDSSTGPPWRPITLKIKNATPGESLSLLFTLHSENLEMCCSQELVSEVPACDCAQVRNLSTCPAFVDNRPQSFTFYLDNLSEEEVSHIFITPISPSDATFTPNHFRHPVDFPGPIQSGGSAGSFPVTVSGPNVFPGSEIEFLVSIHDESFRECCPAQKKRVMLPSTCQPLDCNPVGGATHFFRDGRFVVGNIGLDPPFNDGYFCPLLQPVEFEAAWLPFDRSAALSSGAGFEMVTEGSIGGGDVHELGTVRTILDGGQLAIDADLSPIDSPTQRIEVYRHNELAGVVSGNTEQLRVSLRDGGLWPTRARKLGRLGQTSCYVQEWDDLVEFEIADGGVFVGDELRILSESPVEEPRALESFTFRAAGPSEVVVTEANMIFDCNENGIPDRVDLEAGTSVDADADGIPDECRRGELVKVLNTGFDQQNGNLLPVGKLPDGTADDDWRVVGVENPGPAKVVIEPVAAWPVGFTDSQWISTQASAQSTGADTISYRNCFCLSDEAQSAEIDLLLFADDSATVFLNGQLLGGPGGSFQDPGPLAISHSEQVGAGLFKPGSNCLAVRVADTGQVVTGFVLTGEVRSPNGICR